MSLRTISADILQERHRSMPDEDVGLVVADEDQPQPPESPVAPLDGTETPPAKWTESLSEHKDRFFEKDGHIYFKNMKPDGTFEPHKADTLDEFAGAMGKKGDNANQFIEKITGENRTLREDLAKLTGRLDEISNQRNAPAPALTAPVEDREPDWDARIAELQAAYERDGHESQVAFEKAKAFVRVAEKPEWKFAKQEKQNASLQSQVQEMFGALRGYIATSELSTVNPLASDFKLSNKDVAKLFAENPNASPNDLLALWVGRKALAGQVATPQNGQQQRMATPRQPMTNEELVSSIVNQIRSKQVQPVGGANDHSSGGYVVTDEDREGAKLFGLPADDASIRARATAKY